MCANAYGYDYGSIGRQKSGRRTRLVSACSNGGLLVSSAYDHLHRSVRLSTDIYYEGEWLPFRTRTFVWDDWLLSLELVDSAGGGSQAVEYFWGNDLSGSEQGAGGVGGLVAVSIDGAYYLPCYDHNGNVMAYVSESGGFEAQYVYTPFGEVMSQSGTMADIFRFRFSTKYQDEATGLYYYGYRFYDPQLMRFLSRDPIEEQGGLNLYGLAGNDPVDRWDVLGLIGTLNVRHFYALKNSKERKWLADILWKPPKEWAKKDPSCLPCTKVLWTQRIRTIRMFVGGIRLDSGWYDDWTEETAKKYGHPWTAGGAKDFVAFQDSPGLESHYGEIWFKLFHWIRYDIVASSKCVEGQDKGQVYKTFTWRVFWDSESDEVRGSHD